MPHSSSADATSNLTSQGLRLGLDVGSLCVHGVLLDTGGNVIARGNRLHQGDVLSTTRKMLADWAHNAPITAVTVIGKHAATVARALGLEPADAIGAIVRGLRIEFPEVRYVIDAGGSSLSLIRLNHDGSFAGYEANTLCAAGTGSFLDSQAERLGIRYADMIGQAPAADFPTIAARCAVFAKSDLIHRQQEGFDRAQCWVGLCRGMARTMVMTLFKGRMAEPPLALVGGVARNAEVVGGLRLELGLDPIVPKYPQSCAAHGAALSAKPLGRCLDLTLLVSTPHTQLNIRRRRPLNLQRSHYPSFDVSESWRDDQDTEIRIIAWPENGQLCGWLGFDIGSTSTKAVIIGDDGQVILDLYRRTAGDPLEATRRLLRVVDELARKRSATIKIRGMGTTGSGRKLVGAIFGADRVCNEITAQVAGAMRVNPGIDTIFEIGGQDSKYIHTRAGHLHDANMNYVCAAGTGSFIEELAGMLGFDLETLGTQLLGVKPPIASGRCTVFMEQHARQLLSQGFSPREVMGGAVYAVIQNYLLKVVGHRPRSPERVFFQGATARNQAMVAAFEQLLDVEVIVSPFCHVMGAWGVALLTREQQQNSGAASRFRGLDLADRQVRLETQTCTKCTNRCTLTQARVEALATRPTWGALCGRDPDEDRRGENNRGFAAFRARNRLWRFAGRVDGLHDAPEILMPRALLIWQYAPLWRRLLGELGYRLRLSDATDEATIRASSDWVGADYCFPVKLAHGHTCRLLAEMPLLGATKTAPRVLLPFMVSEREGVQDGCKTRSWFCPYNIGLPAILEAAARLRGQQTTSFLKVTLDLRGDDKAIAHRLHADLGQALDQNRAAFHQAWQAARETQQKFEDDLKKLGSKWLDRIHQSAEPVVVVMGRPYNLYDSGANLALPEKLSRLGLTVLPMEFLPLDAEPLGAEFSNLYWSFGRRILAAAQYVARTPRLYALGLTNFGCGPDSFIWTYAEKVMGEKPMLLLELDEHGADAGYLTRLEAFADVLMQNPVATAPPFRLRAQDASVKTLSERTIWIPPMHEAAVNLTAAALRREGLNARPLPPENPRTFIEGQHHTRGGECLPCALTLGRFIETVRHEGSEPNCHGLFMPTAEGPCRFGQYRTLDRMILDDMGWDPVHLLSWSSTDTYGGKGRRRFWTALVLGDMLFKMRCRVIPYEIESGRTEETFRAWISRLEQAIEGGERLDPLVTQAHNAFLAISRRKEQRPLVGVVGEIYVRSNRFANQDLIRAIERAGGEVWLTPISEWVLYTAYLDSHGLGNSNRGIKARLAARLRNSFLGQEERRWMKLASPLLDQRHEPVMIRILDEGSRFVPVDFVGETILTLGRAMLFVRDGASMVVNCAPFGCMPGAMTAAVLQQVEAETGVPMVNLVYDGQHSGVNERLTSYLANLRKIGATN